MNYKQFLQMMSEGFEGSSIAVEFSIQDKKLFVQRGNVMKTFAEWANAYHQEFVEVVEAMKKKWPEAEFMKKDASGIASVPNSELIQAYIVKYFSANQKPFDIIAALGASNKDQINTES